MRDKRVLPATPIQKSKPVTTQLTEAPAPKASAAIAQLVEQPAAASAAPSAEPAAVVAEQSAQQVEVAPENAQEPAAVVAEQSAQQSEPVAENAQEPAAVVAEQSAQQLEAAPVIAPEPVQPATTTPISRESGAFARQNLVLERANTSHAQVVLIGDSITEGWEGARDQLQSLVGLRSAANLGVGGDRTQHVLWRLQQAPLMSVNPKVIVLMIGTNNIYDDSADDIVAGIRADQNPVDIGVRLSIFDMVPFRPNPATAEPGKPGVGMPEEFSQLVPYVYGFGMRKDLPTEIDLSETHLFAKLCGDLGIKVLNTTAGSPYYNPHLQRPAVFPPSDGYRPAYDPLVDVARQINAVKELKAQAPEGLFLIGSGYTYLQEFLPAVASAVLRLGWADGIGVGRAVLSYPELLSDAAAGRSLEKKRICRTFSDCTTAPRNGLISGCYPLDKFYTQKPEFARLKEIKKGIGA
jgi:hypothetical protein